jgi:hypothetical protein
MSSRKSLENVSQIIVAIVLKMNVYPFPRMHHELKPNSFLLDNYIGLCRSVISKICLGALDF